MAQRFGVYADLTVEENMAFYADLFGIGRQERAELSARLLRMTRMEPFGKRQAGKLSGGMKQKLALMCTLLHKPRVLFLDEPTNGVDPVSRRDFWAILYQLVRDGLTVFMTTAYLDEAERANRVAFMHLGKLIRCDTPGVLRRGLADGCYRVVSENLRETRGILEQQTGVVAVEPSGTDLHVFIDEKLTSPDTLQAVTPFRFERVLPSLEDVFINLIRRQEAGRAA
jgi:ABC-2 type transport system ATP-binding protein